MKHTIRFFPIVGRSQDSARAAWPAAPGARDAGRRPQADNGHVAETAELDVAEERIHELEEQIACLQEPLHQARQSNTGLVSELETAPAQLGPWRRFW